MSISDSQGSQPLTRRRLRELRETGATPVIVPRVTDAEADPTPESLVSETASVAGEAGASSEGQAADGKRPLTRRELRERAQRNTQHASLGADPAHEGESKDRPAASEDVSSRPAVDVPAASDPPTGGASDASESDEDAQEQPARERGGWLARRRARSAVEETTGDRGPETGEAVDPTPATDTADDVDHPGGASTEVTGHDVPAPVSDDEDASASAPAHAVIPPSFDELISSTDTSGTNQITPSALIYSGGHETPSLSGPMDNGGDLVITSTYEFPSSVGSHGHAPGTTDGKDVDAVLIDNELSPGSSHAPVAASSAISTIKPAGEVMRQPVPDKSGKAVLVLSIIAGVIGIVLSGVLILAFVNGVF